VLNPAALRAVGATGNLPLSAARRLNPGAQRTLAAAQLTPRRQAIIPGDAPGLAVPQALTPPASILVQQSSPAQAQAMVPTGDVIGGSQMGIWGSIGGAIKGAVGGFIAGGPAGAAVGAAGSLVGGGRPSSSARGGSAAVVTSGLQSFASSVPRGCPPGTTGVPPLCVNLPGGQVTGGGMVLNYGEAVMARYGAALVPASSSRTVRRCPKGAVLGDDGYCYSRRDISKSQRMWNPGRKPLTTRGDLNAISRAHRAATRLKAQQKRLEAMGMLKKPTRNERGSSRGVITKAEASRALRA